MSLKMESGRIPVSAGRHWCSDQFDIVTVELN